VRDFVWQGQFTDALLLGMGGSSLCAHVLAKSFPEQEGFPSLQILDSIDPAQVRRVRDGLHLDRCLFIVSSKTGNTLETNLLYQYFFDERRKRCGQDAGLQFIAVTDSGSTLQDIAVRDGFAQIHEEVSSIGGRYSALSNVGMVSAAMMGLNTKTLIANAKRMVAACGAEVSIEKNPGVMLGLALGVGARNGLDKVTIMTSPGLDTFGGWLEQLLAESTGKMGKGIIPIDSEGFGSPVDYGFDRLFVYISIDSKCDTAQADAVTALEQSGRPVIRINLSDVYGLSQEFFRWEMATAVAAAVLQINPFNQPDVEVGKVVTRELTDAYEKRGAAPVENPVIEEEGMRLFADEPYGTALRKGAGEIISVQGVLGAHLASLTVGDYFALLAFVDTNAKNREVLQDIRRMVRHSTKSATCLSVGPRFLHSIGQLYKGGPDTGVFLQITCDEEEDLPVPGRRVTFGIVKASQARSDFKLLANLNRRVLRVHLGQDVERGLLSLKGSIAAVLRQSKSR
jgi:transaldolase/glucose-6-phosphate isomerase